MNFLYYYDSKHNNCRKIFRRRQGYNYVPDIKLLPDSYNWHIDQYIK